MVSRPLLGSALAVCAAVLIVLGWVEYFAPIGYDRFGLWLAPAGQEAVVTRVLPGARTTIRHGDTVLLSQMSMSERLRLRTGFSPAGWTISLPIERNGRRVALDVTSASRPRNPSIARTFAQFAAESTFVLLILGLIAWRRPSVATAALLFYGAGSLTTGPLSGLLSWLSVPAFGVATVLISCLSSAPIFGLVPFITRFPHPPQSAAERTRMHVGDALLAVVVALNILQAIFEPLLYLSWTLVNTYGQVLVSLVVLIFAILAYADATGNDRRRIGWVIAGYVVSVAGTTAFNVIDSIDGSITGWGSVVSSLVSCALPIALGYAVLRHRVIDLGFAINRTLIYGAIIGVVIALVSLVDFLTSKAIGEQRVADAVAALLTVAIGFALTFIHRWVERLVDRIVFRQRHLAEKRIEYRIDALDFSETESAVDETLTRDAPEILGVTSAALFRRIDSTATFSRTAATGWPPGAIESIDPNALLVRTMRVMERPFFLDDVAIVLADAPYGAHRPVLAIPIVTQHELVGFVLYGNHGDGSSPDPDDVGLLYRLARAAGTSYGSVEARRWRERATTLERSLVRVPQAEF